MAQQARITGPCDLLDDNGFLSNPGYATKPYWRFKKKKLKSPWYRIREWDYYYILAPDRGYGITFTIASLGFWAMAGVCWLDFQKKTSFQTETVSVFPFRKIKLPSTSEAGTSFFHNRKIKTSFEVSRGVRLLSFKVPGFVNDIGDKGLEGKILLSEDLEAESMAVAGSMKEDQKKFYYNRRINCLPAEGRVNIGDRKYDFSKKTSFGCLDWGRCNWTNKNRWLWSSTSGLLNGEYFGWNLGSGVDNSSSVNENMLFYQGKIHKLGTVKFDYDPNNYLKPWTITSNDGRFKVEFNPLLDRTSDTDLKLIKSKQHQVFGHFTGYAELDDGTRLELNDFLGFADDVISWW